MNKRLYKWISLCHLLATLFQFWQMTNGIWLGPVTTVLTSNVKNYINVLYKWISLVLLFWFQYVLSFTHQKNKKIKNERPVECPSMSSWFCISREKFY